MPLLDHFHPPLSEARHWESFHARWAATIVAYLEKDLLPEGYFAEVQVHIGTRIEVDIGTFSRNGGRPSPAADGGSAPVAVAEAVWAPPKPGLVFPSVFPDEIVVRIFSSEGGPVLVAAIELISPRNKDRAEARRTFAAKCISYLANGVGLVIVDVVTTRHSNMHNEMMNQIGLAATFQLASDEPLYAVAYRPVELEDGAEVHVWPYPLTLGATLPVVPLALRDGPVLPLDLEASYNDLCQSMRMP